MYIVTGGTQGIGAATVEKLVSLGHPIVFTGRGETAGTQLAARLPNCTFVAGDVMNEEDCRSVVATALQLVDGKLAGLLNNAGMSGRKIFTEISR